MTQTKSKIIFNRSLTGSKFIDMRTHEVIIIAIGKLEISKPISVNHTPKKDLDSNINTKNRRRDIARNV